MRMMTGAILVLAHAMLYTVYQLGHVWSPDKADLEWLQWYSWSLAGLGGVFLLWGLARDIAATMARKSRFRHGDR